MIDLVEAEAAGEAREPRWLEAGRGQHRERRARGQPDQRDRARVEAELAGRARPELERVANVLERVRQPAAAEDHPIVDRADRDARGVQPDGQVAHGLHPPRADRRIRPPWTSSTDAPVACGGT